MIRTTIICISLIFQSIAYGDESAQDPFVAQEAKPLDRSKDLSSESFLSKGLLEAFKEKRLDKSSANQKSLIRITIRRSFHSPLMFQWFPSDYRLHVKRLKSRGGAPGVLDIDRSVKLTEEQQKLLKSLYSKASLDALPQDFWQPQALDGSTWIYESTTLEGSILIARRNPIDPNEDCLQYTKIKPSRLSKELQLTSFTLMLWMLSGIDEEPY
jgi:hypothetical protein